MSERKHTDYVIERKYLGKISSEEFVRRMVKSHIVSADQESSSSKECSSLGDCSNPKDCNLEKDELL